LGLREWPKIVAILMRIYFLTKYSRAGASSRYRCYQFADSLEERGHEVEFGYLLDDQYIERLFSGRRQSAIKLGIAFVRRLHDVVRARNYDVVVLQYEAFPLLPIIFERLLFVFNSNVVVDMDDAWYLVYAQRPFLRSKFPWLLSHCRAVVAGSRVIADFARVFNANTTMVPTVVDTRRYDPKRYGAEHVRVELVWIGSPITARLLLPYLQTWQRLSDAYPNVDLKLVGAGENFRLEGVRHRVVAWSEETEASELNAADIGIFPLQDIGFHRGKCALKLIQYMAAGLPVVASAIGANNDIIEDGITGFLASSEEQWLKALSTLIEDSVLRHRMGASGREKAVSAYSIEAAAPVLEGILASSISLEGRRANVKAGPGPS
jgi:glycosyltransferase involved in cell wall biosynthesis